MADLIVYLPSHGYSEHDPIFVSWLNGTYYVDSIDTNSFKLSTVADTDASHPQYVQYAESITSGYVREVSSVAGSTTISGLDHLEGESVYVMSGGVNYGAYTVLNGSVTVSLELPTYQVGLPYMMKVKTTRFAITNEDGTQAKIKRIAETVVRHIRTQGGEAGQEYQGREYLTPIRAEFSTNSEDSTVPTQGGFSPDGYTVFKSSEPYPATVLATVISVEVEEQ